MSEGQVDALSEHRDRSRSSTHRDLPGKYILYQVCVPKASAGLSRAGSPECQPFVPACDTPCQKLFPAPPRRNLHSILPHWWAVFQPKPSPCPPTTSVIV